MHRPKTCSQNGQSVEMPENEKIFQQQILPAPSSVTEITPILFVSEVVPKFWKTLPPSLEPGLLPYRNDQIVPETEGG